MSAGVILAMQRKKIPVDREEYAALCALRDVEHQRVRLESEAHRANLDACLAINRGQCARLSEQDLQLTYLQSQVAALQTELARWKPVVTGAGAQPLFSKQELGR